MDKLQRWLKNKEEESPSPSLRSNPASLGDKLKMTLNGLGRIFTLSQVPQKGQYSLTDDEELRRKIEEDHWEWRAKNFPVKSNYSDPQSIKNARKEIVAAIKNPILYCHATKTDNLDEAIKDMKTNWKWNYGFEWDVPREKLIELRKNAIQPEVKRLMDEIYGAVSEPCLTERDILNPLERLSALHRSVGMEFDGNELWREVLSQYPSKAPTIPLKELLDNNPEHYIVHGIPASGKKSSLENNHALRNRRANMTWKDFLNLVLDHTPTLSCSSVTKNSSQSEFYSRVGVIVEDGKVYNAFSQDGCTQTYARDVRLPLSDLCNHGKDINARVQKALHGRTGRYNELVVGSPQIKGIFYTDGIQRETTGRCEFESHTPFLDDEWETQKAIKELAQIAKERGIPMYRFERGKGFVEESTR